MACIAWPKRNFLQRKTQQTIATTDASEAAERTTLRSRGSAISAPPICPIADDLSPPSSGQGISRGPTPRLGSAAPKPGELQ